MSGAWKQWEGQVVNGEFPLRQYLGGSEHSAVFLTEHGEQLQKAAIKLIPADPANAEPQLSWWRLAAELSHPHLIRLFQMGRCQLGGMELLYAVMECAEEDLSQVLPYRTLTPAEARDMLESVLGALAYVHGQGFVHGHMKPANVMAIGDQLKVSIDALCRTGESSGGLGKQGVYDPPEAAVGEISQAGEVWSLGIMLVEALTQSLPIWERTEQGDPILPETIPAPFLDIARHCLRRDPQLRWTFADITARLQQPVPVPRKRTTARPREASAKWRYIVPTAAIALALVAVLAGPRLLNRRQETQRAPSIASPQPPVQLKVQPKLEKRPATPETSQSTQRASDKAQGSSGAAPLSTSLRSDPGAKKPTGGLVRGEVLQQVLPDVPQTARDTIRGTVRVSVRVHVDPSGSVVGATLDSPGPSKYFADLAMRAARRWEFVPPKVDGSDVSSEWSLRFEFAQTAIRVFPVQAAP